MVLMHTLEKVVLPVKYNIVPNNIVSTHTHTKKNQTKTTN